MKVVRVFNNNAVLVENEANEEMVLIGKGIAFAKKTGDLINEELIQKKFVFENSQLNEKLAKLFNEVPVKYIELTLDIVEMAGKELNTKFNSNIYIALADHIAYAVERCSNNETIKNALLWEIKKFYPNEFAAAMKALEMIRYETNIEMTEDEAGFIALHFVNGQSEGELMAQTVAVTKIVEDILNIVEYHFHFKIDETSLNYIRFVTHIQYFARRLFAKEVIDDGDDILFEQIKNRYQDSYNCSLKVKKYIGSNYHIDISNDELVYFILHINRVCNRKN
ncbi:MAG: PRD domain-containing protein [Firmicutes bacterium]|nr:PRD domain-containing protein [Bacillota bacterium]MDY4972220.1 PRD domain-containing protein [Erysipelotrichaceae bacterium]MDY5998354.1 PRD domain-containing protein [Erysipelotrichaceae bacterium]